ncbi:MAG: hypothetical protein U0165_17435 [Polyangiaceae bacterium]
MTLRAIIDNDDAFLVEERALGWLWCGQVAPPLLSAVAETSTQRSVAAVSCNDDLSLLYSAVDPGGAQHGTILRCTRTTRSTLRPLDQLARTVWYDGPTLTSGAKFIQVVQLSEGMQAHRLGFPARSYLVPDHPRAEKLPVVVVAHGAPSGSSELSAFAKSTK